ncbi:MAG TPA: ATP-binding cassette domain-containing protein [Humibacillus sp.]|nr:ATP-binding cassette domain-containing protein [Humibacillus sp.]
MTTVSAVTLRGVSAAFGATRDRPLDLDVPPGSRVWISGPSGVGKTSLLYVLGALTLARGGSVTVGGVEVTSSRVADDVRRRHVGFVLQDAQLIEHWSIARNLEVMAGTDRAAEATRRLEEWGVPITNRAPRALSGGERQRVVTAGALAKRPAVIVADEPTSSLDEESRDGVIASFADAAAAGAAVVVSSHDPAWDAWATQRVRLGADRG